jgi:hypothetical protein
LFDSYLQDRQHDFKAGIPNEPTVFVAVRRRTILGYIALRDWEMKSRSGKTKHYLLVPATATSVDNADPHVFVALVDRAFRFRHDIDPLHRIFRGAVCIPQFNRAIDRMLRRLGFESFPSPFDDFLWHPFNDYEEED